MGRPTKRETDKKLAVLEKIRERKSVLFGQFSTEIEKTVIEKAWGEVLVYAKSIAILGDAKDISHLRKLFSQWKSRTLEKKDNSRRTGTGGGKNCQMNEVDHLILDIVGKDSPVVEGLPVGESGTFETCEFELLSPTRNVFDEEDVNDAINEVHPAAPAQAGTSTAATRHERPTFQISTKKRKLASEKDALLDEKWRAQVEFLKQQAYNIQLQNFKLENELGLPHAELTTPLLNIN